MCSDVPNVRTPTVSSLLCPEVSRNERYLHKGDVSPTVLLAVSVDSGNYAVKIAWALAEGESEFFWRWFLTHLDASIPNINSPLLPT